MIDLHMHSTFSDGSQTPEELVANAHKTGLYAMALTDHDTVGGISRFTKACNAYGIKGIPGVEMSADFPSGTMHILGYGIDWRDTHLNEHLKWIQGGRSARNEEMLYKLQQLGLHLTWKDITKEAGEDVIGRVHFAKALVKKGYVSNTQAAFDQYLAKGKSCYAERRKLSPSACLQLIHDAGGLSVLAHPSTLRLSPPHLRRQVRILTEQGLCGLEILYPDHDTKMISRLRKLTKAYHLLETGGTDFHGDATPNISIGKGRGSMNIPDELANNILKRTS